MNIYQKISAVMNDVQYLAKDDKVEFGKTNYKAISEEKVTRTMREALIKHGLVVFPIEQKRERVNQITSVDVTYRIQNIDDPEDFITVVSSGDGADTQDKGAGKAMTYAFKYMFLRTFAIPTGEDPDKISSAELDAKQEAEALKKAEAEQRNPIGKTHIATIKNMVFKLVNGDADAAVSKFEELTGIPLGTLNKTTVREWDFAVKKLSRMLEARDDAPVS